MRKPRFQCRKGAALAEFAIASVVFLMLVFGAVEFERAIHEYNVVSNAARSAVRWAAVRGNSSGQTPATASDVHDYIVTMMYGVTETDTVTWNPVDKQPGAVVQVIVHSDYTLNIPLMPAYTVPLRSRAQMIVVR